MKKYFKVLLLIAVITAGSFSPASATEYLLGLRGGYFVWDPWLKDLHPQFDQMGKGTGSLYGPVASVLLTDDLSISVSGLFGNQRGGDLSEGIYREEDGTTQDLKFSFDIFRMDIDGVINYRLGDNFKIFAGYKYWYMKTDYNAIEYRYDAANTLVHVYRDDMTITQPFNGPAAGLGFSLPIGAKGYFVAANVSGLYLWGKFKYDSKPRVSIEGPLWAYNTEDAGEAETDMKMYGVNIEPTIGVNPGEGYPIFTVGVRYQYNKLKIVDAPPELQDMNQDWMTDKIYGMFVGVLYQI